MDVLCRQLPRAASRRSRLRARGGRSCSPSRPRRARPPTATASPIPFLLLPADNAVEHAGRRAAGGPELGRLHRAHGPGHRPAPRLRHRVGRRAHRHPVRRRARRRSPRSRSPSTTPTRATPGRTRSRPTRRSRAAPACRRRPPRARARRRQPASSTSSTTPTGRPTARWQAGSGAVFDLRVERAAAGRLDLGRRGRAADPARAGALRRGRRRGRDRPRAALHRGAHAARLRLPGDATTPASSTDPDLPPMGLRVRLSADFDIGGFPPACRSILRGAQEVRHDRRRQRQRLVRLRRARRALGRRHAARARRRSPAPTSRSWTRARCCPAPST